MRIRVALAAATLVVAGALGVQGQDTGKPGHFPVVGTVVDASTGRPVFAASVALRDTRKLAYTDSAGRFVLQRVNGGPAVLEVEQLGYHDAASSIEVGPATAPITIVLQPDPVLLKSITVLSDRFARRRNSVVMSVRSFDRQAILTSGAYDMRDFLATRSGVFGIPCTAGAYYYGVGFGGAGLGTEANALGCVFVRGQVVRPSVWIDDRPAFADELAMYNPQDFFLIEVYGRGVMVRAYTTWWVAGLAGHRLPPLPYY
jgi:hypothetical protein